MAPCECSLACSWNACISSIVLSAAHPLRVFRVLKTFSLLVLGLLAGEI